MNKPKGFCKGCSFKCIATGCECTCHDKPFIVKERPPKGESLLLGLLLVAAILSATSAASAPVPCTREMVIWQLQQGTYGAVSWDTPSVVEWYYGQVCGSPKAAAQALLYYPNAPNRTEVRAINSTHELALIYQFHKNVYNITRGKPVNASAAVNISIPVKPEIDLCSARFISAFNYALYAHELQYNETFKPNFKANIGGEAGYGFNRSIILQNDSIAWRGWERYYTKIYADYLYACSALNASAWARIIANLEGRV